MSENNSLVIFTKAALMLAEADTIQKANELKNLALTAADWARRKGMGEDAIKHCRSYALEAERKMGEMLRQTERAKANQYTKSAGLHGVTEQKEPTLADLGLTKRESSEAQKLAAIPKEHFEKIKDGEMSKADAIREIKRKEIIENLESIESKKTKEISGIYDVIVIDPPWPMQKIERDVAPEQVAFDYPIMTMAEIENLNIPCAENCHVWLWTTHKFIKSAFNLLEYWNLKYVCCFVWHKNGGFQPFGLPQYNCEFALYARKGSPIFTDVKAFNVCFSANRTSHSEKPKEFYDLIRRVTSGRRLDMFNRRNIDGFDGWGKEAK